MKTKTLTTLIIGFSLCLALTSMSASITNEEIHNALDEWGQGLVDIGEHALNPVIAKVVASQFIDQKYDYESDTDVMFKPTKAATHPFRENKKDALSYFVGGEITEDSGFALEPWEKVYFPHSEASALNLKKGGTYINGNYAVTMGEYYFESKSNPGNSVKVEYTFGFVKNNEGEMKINLHHSSLPYNSGGNKNTNEFNI